MKIGVVSDTHGRIDTWRKVENIFAGADLIVHAGDVLYHPPRLGYTDGYDIPALVEAMNHSPVPIVIAQGNCDSQVYEELLEMPVQSPYATAYVGDTRILINHGHTLTREDMIRLGGYYKTDVFVSGHTHTPVLEKAGSLVLMNPGSPSIPKIERDGRIIGSVGLITDTHIRILDIDTEEILFELAR
ncbi:MAG: phosphodiesterase [Armatimonadota bacterium]